MFWNDLKSACRNLRKRKFAALVNGIGLAIGVAFFILLAAYIRDETTYDRFHPRADRIYLVTNEFRDRFYGGTPHFLGEMLKAGYPEVGDVVRLSFASCLVRFNGEIAYRDIAFADPEFLKMFHFPLVLGDPGGALADPGRIILSREAARAYFGAENPVGKRLSVRLGDGYQDFLVSGVLAPIPGNSSIRFDALVHYRNMFRAFGIDEANLDLLRLPLATATFLRLENADRAASLQAKLPALQRKIFADLFEKAGIQLPKYGMGLIRFQDYHLGDVETVFFEPRSRSSYSLILSGIALLVLLLACFNYTNLALGQAATRLKEIAVRKAVGSREIWLVRHFLAESLLQSLLASALGLALAAVLFPPFNALTGKALGLQGFRNGGPLLFLAGLVVFIGLAAGAYPAVLLSRQQTVDLFRGRSALGRKAVLSRALLVLQFAISLFFIFVTTVMAAQLHFLTAKELGFDPNHVVAIETQLPMGAGKASRELVELFRNELRSYPGVVAVTADSGLMGTQSGSLGHAYVKDGREVEVQSHMIDRDYLGALGIPLAQGRNFSPEFASDASDAALVNETLVRSFRISDPVGKRFSEIAVHDRPKGLEYDPVIIGVVKDFHDDSLHFGIAPSAFGLFDQTFQRYRRILVKVRPNDLPGSVAQIKRTWEKICPDKPFAYEFLDDALGRQYRKERNWGRILKYSAGAAVLIACLGLFGMAALAAARRTKEIGIRKVLGAPQRQIILTLSREFLVMIGLAHLIAWPLAYWAGRRWLETFAYRTGIGSWIFVLSSGLITIISLLTLSGQALRAARTDPVRALRHE